MKTVVASGSLDNIRSPDLRFLQEAARLGALHVLLWSDAAIEPGEDPAGWTVSLTVRNSGPRAGAEVVQLYVAPPGQAVPRPSKELRGFARVELGPGEARRVAIPLPRRSLAYWDTGAGAWRVEAGEHRFLLGASSRDIRLEGVFDTAR